MNNQVTIKFYCEAEKRFCKAGDHQLEFYLATTTGQLHKLGIDPHWTFPEFEEQKDTLGLKWTESTYTITLTKESQPPHSG